jgi:hypothetical protein
VKNEKAIFHENNQKSKIQNRITVDGRTLRGSGKEKVGWASAHRESTLG